MLVSERVVRIMPGKRMVVFGKWKGKQVVAKLFFEKQHAKKHMEKDVAGFKLLSYHKIPTPTLYDQTTSADKKIHILIFERILDAENLDEIWRSKNSVAELLPLLQSVIVEIATQHVFGIVQQDLHFKNFILNEKTVFTLDGGQIQIFSDRLPQPQSMRHLALFLSQLGAGTELYQEKLFRFYAKSRGWSLKPKDIKEIFHMISCCNKTRWRKFSKKIFRESTDFACRNDQYTISMYNRRFQSRELLDFLSNPDSVFKNENIEILKSGHSATVIKTKFNNLDCVIKRYNIKNFQHRIRRCFRSTRAAKSWRIAQKFHLFGISTPTPIAFIEKRFFGFRAQSYYVSEYVAGEHAGIYLQQHAEQKEKTSMLIKKISALLKSLAQLNVTHGDLKITNILVNEKAQPVLIDLDGAKEHTKSRTFEKYWCKDIARLLNNFSPHTLLRSQVEKEFLDI